MTARGKAKANAAVVAVEACDDAFFAPLGRHAGELNRALATLAKG